jgi:hypothetical protein
LTDRPQVDAIRGKRRGFLWLVYSAALLLLVLLVASLLVNRHVEPILRARVIESLSTRFNSRVELGEFHVRVLDGLQVEGSDAKLYPLAIDRDLPLLAIRRFSFHTSWRELLHTPMHIQRVRVEGLAINLPPKDQRKQIPGLHGGKNKVSIYLEEIDVDDAHLTLGTNKPGKIPLDFEIRHLVLNSVGQEQPMKFQATLVNPKPVGDIATTGYFGPFDSETPGDSSVNGSYEFSHADLGTIKGIGGILSSKGRFSGALNRIVVDGYTDTPDFQISISGHKVPLHTTFHAIVDGTSGDTYLQPVDATLLGSHILASGFVVRAQDRSGHHIVLDVTVDKARIEDLLRVAVRTDPPVMTGAVRLKTKLDLPAGDVPVSEKLRLVGTFGLTGAHFTREAVQKKIDSLSLRSQGKPEEAMDDTPDNVRSRMSGNFTLLHSQLALSNLQYIVPGLMVKMDGVYSLDGNEFDFHGTARMDAKLSQMTTGWKSILLKPVDPFFAKNGAGTEVPIKLTGTRSEPKFGLDFGHKDSTDAAKSNPSPRAKPDAGLKGAAPVQ